MDKIYMVMESIGADTTNGGYMISLDEARYGFHTKDEAEGFLRAQQERVKELEADGLLVHRRLYIKEVKVPSKPLVWKEHLDEERRTAWFSYPE